MQNTPLATVIVPTYNSPDLFGTLLSILRQDYPRIQLVLIDDGSSEFCTTEVEAFIRQNGGDHLEDWQVIVNPENRGTVRTLNLALGCSKGDYIFNLAGDDCFYDEQVLSDWVEAFLATGAQVMTALRAVYDPKLETFSHVEPSNAQVAMLRSLSPQLLFEKIAGINFIFGCCTARTAKCVEKYGLFDEGYRLLEDHPMNLKLLRSGEPIVFFDRIVIKYRGGGTSSPIRYNAVYEKDVDRVMECDVLPYTKHPVRIRWQHYQWKREQRLLRRRAQLLAHYGNRGVMRGLIQVWYYLHHPWRTLCRLPGKIQKIGESK